MKRFDVIRNETTGRYGVYDFYEDREWYPHGFQYGVDATIVCREMNNLYEQTLRLIKCNKDSDTEDLQSPILKN